MPLPVQNSPCSSCAGPLPVQNSPCSPEMALFGVFCACWASFVPPVGRDGDGVKEKPPLREVLWGVVKYSSPRHAEKRCILPILGELGRYFFH